VVRILIDGKPIGDIAWPPYEIDITDALSMAGRRKIEIMLYSGRRNLLGPLHFVTRHPSWTGPTEFVTEGALWTNGYMNLPVGLMEEPCLVVKE
jgi:hypothetical protein